MNKKPFKPLLSLKGCTQFAWPLITYYPRDCLTAALWRFTTAGLLASGSTYFPLLPTRLLPDSGLSRSSSPVTAAGPHPIFTGFPIKPNWHPDQVCVYCISEILSSRIDARVVLTTLCLAGFRRIKTHIDISA